MTTIAQMTRAARTELRRLGVEREPVVRWGGIPGGDGHGGTSCTWRSRTLAHAHVSTGDGQAMICITREAAASRYWRDTIRHEVAHFGPGGNAHGSGFIQNLATLGDTSAKRHLVATGKRRCPKHRWLTVEMVEQTVRASGLVRRYRARCANCGKAVG